MITNRLLTLKKTISVLKPSELSFSRGICPLCGCKTFIKLRNQAWAVRCLQCRASIAHMAIADVFNRKITDPAFKHVYELSSRGPFFQYLKKKCGMLTFSEFFDDISPGQYRGDVPCQDVQHLTFDDETFDVCTSTEVFEHVPNDFKGFSELYRVLKKDGILIFTVLLSNAAVTVERAKLQNNEIIHLLPAAYHGDRLRGANSVLCFRDYGRDVTDRLKAAGFRDAEIKTYSLNTRWNLSSFVVVGYK